MKRSIVFATLILVFVLILACNPVTHADSESEGRIFKIGILPYGAGYLKEPLKQQVTRWIAQNFDWVIGGPSTVKDNPEATWVTYEKILGGYSSELNNIKDFALKNGWKFEDMLLHMKVNYSARKPWAGMDKFDFFEGKNGVLSENSDGTYLDMTKQAYEGKAKAPVAFGKALYVGYEEPFALINLTFSRYGTGKLRGWEYWDGSNWNRLAVADDTLLCSKDGQVRFTPPADWKQKSLNGSRAKWWVRFVTEGGGKPVASRIWGDSWLAEGDQGTNCRGWDPTSPSIINRGTPLEYNPTPPSNATAHFRYQARATGYWGPTYFFYNPKNIQGGVRTSAAFIAAGVIARLEGSGAHGIMFDSALNGLTTGIKGMKEPEKQSDFMDSGAGSWGDAATERYADVVQQIRKKLPAVKLGVNVFPHDERFIRQGDWALYEYHTFPRNSGFPRLITQADQRKGMLESYDAYQKKYNPQGIKGVFIYADLLDYDGKRQFYWDRAQRGPMAALSKHYIGMNANTYFVYYSEGAFRYSSSDEVYYFKAETPLVTDLKQDFSGAVKYLHGTDFSKVESIPSFGMRVKIDQQIIKVQKMSNTTLTTSDSINENYRSGEKIQIIGVIHQAVDQLPPLEKIYRWNYLFPAMKVDIGVPDRSGHNQGQHDLSWKETKVGGEKNEIWRRDFSKAIVLHRPAYHNTPAEQYSVPGAPIPLKREYYPLQVDGTTGPSITSIALRAAEGAILMKEPVGAAVK